LDPVDDVQPTTECAPEISASGIITTVAGSGKFGLVNTGLGLTSTG
jgi:hypothetical protein